MRKRRVLVLLHADLVPPDDAAERKKLSEAALLEMKTEYDVITGLRQGGHEVQPLGLIDDLTPLRRAIAEFKPHIVFNLLEEFHGQAMLDQNVVSYLELVQMHYTGCNPRGLMIARDKALSKKILMYHRMPCPRFIAVPRGRSLRKKPARLEYPLIVKSQMEEASEGISEASVVTSDDKLMERVQFIHDSVGSAAIVEQFIEGRELYIGVMGHRRLQVLPTWELEIENLRADAPNIATRSVKWDPKYQKRRGVRIGPARDLPEEVTRRLVHVSKRMYRALGLSGYARIDFRLDENNRPFFLEANPNPDIGSEEEFAAAAAFAGIPYPELLDRILRLGLRNR